MLLIKNLKNLIRKGKEVRNLKNAFKLIAIALIVGFGTFTVYYMSRMVGDIPPISGGGGGLPNTIVQLISLIK